MPVALLCNIQYYMMRLIFIISYSNCLVPVGIKRLSRGISGLNSMKLQQPSQLLQRHFDTLVQVPHNLSLVVG
ncbi:hypothetical protein BH09VER1_BH09VER1_15060 [soil metagenome]